MRLPEQDALALQRAIGRHLEGIRAHFKVRVKITLLVRSPDTRDGDVVLTDDDLDKAIATLEKRKAEPVTVVGDKYVGYPELEGKI